MSVRCIVSPTHALFARRLSGLLAFALACACAQQSGGSSTLPAGTDGTPTAANSNTVAQPLTPSASPNNVLNSPNEPVPKPTVTQPADSNTTPGATEPNAVAGGTPAPNGNDVAISPVSVIASPNIGFDAIPRNDNKAVALTFDDGPDGAQGATDLVLDTLKKEGLKATFFICANIGFADLETDAVAQRQLKRILAEGHSIANHSYGHKDLASLKTDAELEDAFGHLESIYKKVLGPTAPQITMIRAPFGSPFQLDPETTKRVAPVVTKYGVEIGWGMDPKDWSFDHFSTDPTVVAADTQKVIDAVQKLIDNKQWGIVLLHAVHLPSAKALPTVISMFRNNGYHFISVEDAVRSQYGANSASIMAANKGATTAPTGKERR